MNKYLKLGLAGLLLLGLGIAIGRYTLPEKSKEQTTVEKDSKRETTITVREEIRPDGTKIKETINSTKKEDSQKKEKLKIVENKKPQWLLGVSVQQSLKTKDTAYELNVARRQLGPVFAVGQLRYEKADMYVGLGVLVEY